MDIGKSPSLRLPGATAWRMNWSVPDQTQKVQGLTWIFLGVGAICL